MKKAYFFTVIFSCFFLLTFAQEYEPHVFEHDVEGCLEPNGWVRLSTNAEDSYRLCDCEKCNGLVTDTFDNGVLSHIGTYLDGKPHGAISDYYQNGQVMLKGNCENGKKIGEWLFYYENGRIESIITYRGRFGGVQKSINFYVDGNVENKEEWSEDGFFLYSYSFTQEGDTTNAYFIQDWQTKTYTYFDKHENGGLAEKGQKKYTSEDGWLKIGIWRWYDEAGNLIKEQDFGNN